VPNKNARIVAGVFVGGLSLQWRDGMASAG
jgi:hypothetical protein